ncbi:hypothetical protein JCM21900_003989 [Sporobolomyces salmonicolor]
MVAAPLPPPPPRRVSYVIPPPSAPPPLLALPPFGIPRRGHTTPLFTFTGQLAEDSRHKYAHEQEAHPRHRLAVQALALDFSTALSHDGVRDTAPDGILYTGGRDGLLCSWELGLPSKRRRRRYGVMELEEGEDAVDSGEDDEREDDVEPSEQAELNDLGRRSTLKVSTRTSGSRTAGSSATRRASVSSTSTTKQESRPEEPAEAQLPVEEQWEVDNEAVKRLSSPPKARFRQCVQSHTDWVNDIVLCNYNRTLVSASSDSLVLAWNPHSSDHHDQVTPTQVGRHGDYVRCLATARETHWVASGGFDRKIKLWDVGEGRTQPLIELPSPPASVYSLGTTPSGSLIGAGTPERVVRFWDPRSRKQVSRLGGHTDNIRAVLISEEGKWVLSASSDSTVKLWSLTAQKCLHTFSHHASSVWSLFSQHPTLEIFYSGDRNGNLCKVDLEGTGDPGEGECLVLARDGPEDGDEGRTGSEGITQLVAQDDSWVWTAGGSSTVKRWKDIAPRSRRAGAVAMRAKESGDEPSLAEYRALDSTADLSLGLTGSSLEVSPSSSTLERDRPSVSFHDNLTAPLTRTASSPTPRFPTQASGTPRSPSQASHLALAGRPSSLRTTRQSLASTTTTRPLLEHLGSSSSPTSLCDIPYDSLVPLTLPEDTYFTPAFTARQRDPDAATIYSPMSGVSAPGLGLDSLHRPQLVAASSSSLRRPHSIVDISRGATNVSQRDYLDRESAAEATPLRSGPDDLIEGGYGLIRCELLNDRQHALTLDTENELALWDVVRGCCVGVFASDELQDALAKRRPSETASSVTGSGRATSSNSTAHGFDLLEYVKHRIEGEVTISTWCKCDTRVGALTIHVEEARAFDAEAYIDECGIGPPEDFPPDHRLSLGKWVLRQLFDGFVEAEMATRVTNTPPQGTALFGSDPTDAPSFISLSGLPSPPTSPRARAPRTPGMTIALATPALNKAAVLPDLPTSPSSTALGTSPRFGLSELAPIPQSPAAATPIPNALTPVGGGKTPTMDRVEGDYFSLRPAFNEQPASAPLATTTSAATMKGGEQVSSPSLLPTPGGGTFMGRLKLRGKGSKRSVTTTEVPALSSPIPLTIAESDDRTIEEQQQHQILEAVFSRPLAPCPLVDAPRIRYDPDMAVIISEETADAWAVKYRGLIGTSYEDMSVLEQKAPLWLLEFLLGNRTFVKDPVKVSFVLQPWKDGSHQSLPELPNANARLTANRSLRVRKVCSYVADKLDLRRPSRAPSIMDGSTTASNAYSAPAVGNHLFGEFNPEVEIEILVNDQLLPINVTLATIRHCMWKNGGDVVLTYRTAHREEGH